MFIPLYLITLVLMVLLQSWARGELKHFHRMCSAIDSPQALEAFKTLARRNMYAALAFLLMLVFALLFGALAAYRLGAIGVFGVLISAVLVLLHGRALKPLEQQARSLQSSPEFEPAYKKVSESWVKKMLPDF
jgi:hypothetical protein